MDQKNWEEGRKWGGNCGIERTRYSLSLSRSIRSYYKFNVCVQLKDDCFCQLQMIFNLFNTRVWEKVSFFESFFLLPLDIFLLSFHTVKEVVWVWNYARLMIFSCRVHIKLCSLYQDHFSSCSLTELQTSCHFSSEYRTSSSFFAHFTSTHLILRVASIGRMNTSKAVVSKGQEMNVNFVDFSRGGESLTTRNTPESYSVDCNVQSSYCSSG